MKNHVVMKHILYLTWCVVCVALCTSCSTINTLYYDQLQPGKVSFPEAVRSVAIINNMPTIVGGEKELSQTDGVLEGDGKIAAEALAQGIAATGYFDEVIICDSALCQLKVVLKNHQGVKKEWQGNVLDKNTADEWLDKLGVDMLLSFERIYIELKENTAMDGLLPVPVVDGAISTVLRAYVPERSKPIFRVNSQDTIFWEPGPSLSFTKIVKESSEFAASILVPYLLPSWDEAVRNYFDGGSVEMRDAGVYVREHNWEEAALLWKKIYDTKKGQKKMRAAYNLALYSEMQGNLTQAKAYIDEAIALVKPETVDATLVRAYQLQLDAYEKKYQQLRIQMSRFDDK